VGGIVSRTSFNYHLFAQSYEDFFYDERYRDWIVLLGPCYFAAFEFRGGYFNAIGIFDDCRFVA
jgi:hypothetical protein